eukprot:TRINITY_DN13847_c0_g1_i1.p1 TRINITY_DN13847_c0_g1~~TRINITY_DN13847_c0_g1_i1.p1  ORF type:complete len:145 (-),score=43.43 TRINITY_DN13847_c0_g1_i1:39-473(-)
MIDLGEHIWISYGTSIIRIDAESLSYHDTLSYNHNSNITDMCIVDNTYVWSCTSSGQINLFSCDGKFLKLIFLEPSISWQSLCLAGSQVWASGSTDTIYMFESSSQELKNKTKPKHSDDINSLVLVFNRIVWSGSSDKTICVWS